MNFIYTQFKNNPLQALVLTSIAILLLAYLMGTCKVADYIYSTGRLPSKFHGITCVIF